MLCPTCKHEMGKTDGVYQFRECGLDNLWLINWPIYVCSECHFRMPLLPDPDVLVPEVVGELVRQEERMDADAILFLRKAMGLKAIDLAHILGVDRVTVSRWENDKTIDAIYDFRLRLEAIDRLLLSDARREAREEVTLIFQRAYRREVPVSQVRIELPREAVAIA